VHPAASLVVFTVAAGAGYGLLFLLGIAAPLGLVPSTRWFGLVALGLSLGLISLGLAASTLHLGHPERAWRAFSQWRTSWLSREGVAAVVTYALTAPFAVAWVIFTCTGGLWGVFGGLSAAAAVVTVACTGMIYASLKPIRQWHNAWVVPVFLALSLMTGALWLSALARTFGAEASWAEALAAAALIVAWALKLGYWAAMARPAAGPTPESATGLGHLGRVRMLDPPHTEENYLQREMGFRVARKHARRLRRFAVFFGLAVPLALVALASGVSGGVGVVALLVAAVAASLGVLIERWLFFAEAKHTVVLYYGQRSL
jgi:DMSO reductase anchor subunit